MRNSGERLLRLLQRYVDQPEKVKQIHSRLIVSGRLLRHTAAVSPPWKWLPTLLYNSLVRSYSRSGHHQWAIAVFSDMLRRRATPNPLTFPPLIKSSVEFPRWGRSLHSQAIRRGVSSDPFISTSFISFYARAGRLDVVNQVFDEITNPCLVAMNAMLDAFCRNGEVRSAISLFDSMPEWDVVSWTSIVGGLNSNGYFHEAIEFFGKMNVRPNEATYVCILSSCAHLQGAGGLRRGKQIHGHLIRCKTELKAFIGTALIDLYGKTGRLKNAENVFRNIGVRMVCSWNAMISCLACNGEEMRAVSMFREMLSKGEKPNALTFVAVLSACARGELIETGLELYRSMSQDFGLEPGMEHNGCIVDLLGKAGLLTEALEFINSMPYEPDVSVLGSLLGACKIHGAIDLGNIVGRKLLKIQPNECRGRPMAMWNMVAETEEWNAAANLRKSIKEFGFKKDPALSFLDSLEI